MIKLLIFLALLSGCGTYHGTITTPEGRKYQVEQTRPGSIEIDDNGVKVKASTQSESMLKELTNLLLLKELNRAD